MLSHNKLFFKKHVCVCVKGKPEGVYSLLQCESWRLNYGYEALQLSILTTEPSHMPKRAYIRELLTLLLRQGLER